MKGRKETLENIYIYIEMVENKHQKKGKTYIKGRKQTLEKKHI
jgi:hypothetical protein